MRLRDVWLAGFENARTGSRLPCSDHSRLAWHTGSTSAASPARADHVAPPSLVPDGVLEQAGYPRYGCFHGAR
jgi:hypothetical protein